MDSPAEVERLRARVAELEERVALLDALAHQDALVAIPNRRGFRREMESAIARLARYGESSALLFIDIDGLKRINDSFGHKAGDDALIGVAAVLAAGVRRTDVVARLGGDEFAVLLSHSGEAEARDTATRLTAAIEAEELDCDGNSVSLGVAIGVAMVERDDDPDAAIARADEAMYAVKAAAA